MARLTAVLLVALLAGSCTTGAPGSPSAAASGHRGHASSDPAMAAVEERLRDAFGLEFHSAGPHHVAASNDAGEQVDLVGVPVEQIVISIPADDAARARDRVQQLFSETAALVGADERAMHTADELLAGWDPAVPLHEDRTVDGLTLSVRSSRPPPYVVLSVVRAADHAD